MSDLISRQETLYVLANLNSAWVGYEKVSQLPTIDAVPVVRCKDCKHNLHHGKPNTVCGLDIPIFDCNGFCSEGEWGDDPSHPFADDVMMGERKDDV